MKPDKEFVKDRFGRKLPQYHRLAQVQQGIAGELATVYKLHFDPLDVKRIYEAGAGTGFLTRYLRFTHPKARFFLNDITEASAPFLRELMAEYDTQYLWGDAEQVPMPTDLDAVLSASTIQWFHDVPGFVTKAAEATRPGGALALSTFGPDNFREIKAITHNGLDYMTRNQLGEIVSAAGYEVLHLSEQTRVLYFDIPLDVIYHVKYTGVNALMPARWTRTKLEEFNREYRRLFLTRDGVVPLTYHPIFVVARKK